MQTYPESTGEESDHAAHVAWFLARWCDALIDTLAEPNVGLHVPRVKEYFKVGWELDLEDLHVRRAIPMRCSMSTDISESQTSYDACTLVILSIKGNTAE